MGVLVDMTGAFMAGTVFLACMLFAIFSIASLSAFFQMRFHH
jgi:hypothetical protein